MTTPLPDELLRFIAWHIHSVEQLEILCVLAHDSAKAWTEDEVFKEIQSSRDSVAANLRYFHTHRLLAVDSQKGYRFSPESENLTQLVLELVRTYRERRVTVIEVIYKRPSDPIRDFAEAFRIRKDKS